MQRLSQDFLAVCKTRELRPASIRIYREHLARFVAWWTAEQSTCPPPSAVTTEVALRYLSTQPTWSAAYKKQFLSALRTCLAYGRQRGLAVGTVQIETIRGGRRLPRVFTEAEVRRLFQAAGAARDALARRDRAILAVLYYGGLRAAEVCALDVAAVDLDGRCLLVDGKGRRERLVHLPAEALPPLTAHLAAHPGGPSLFHTREGARLTRKALVMLLERRAHAAALTGRIHPHALRHSRATHLLDHGAPIDDVSELLGHADVSTTMLYRHVSKAKLKRTVDQYGRLGAIA